MLGLSCGEKTWVVWGAGRNVDVVGRSLNKESCRCTLVVSRIVKNMKDPHKKMGAEPLENGS